MSDPIIVAIIAAGAVVAGQVVTLVVSIRHNSSQSKQLIEIHTLTDGNLTRVSNALDVANEKIERMQKLIGIMVASTKVTKALADKQQP